MDCENIMPSKINHTEKVKNDDFTHMWYIKLKATNEQTRKAETDTDNSMVATGGQIHGHEGRCAFGWGAHTLQCTDDVSYNCTIDISVTLLTNVTPIHLIFKRREKGERSRVKFKVLQYLEFRHKR